jgi:hypothetical protein
MILESVKSMGCSLDDPGARQVLPATDHEFGTENGSWPGSSFHSYSIS